MTLQIASKAIFWVCTFLVIYTYLLYPFLLFIGYVFVQGIRDIRYVWGRRERRAVTADREMPYVSMVVAAYNEEQDLPRKLENIRTLAYPPERLQVLFVSDGSDDRTNDILSSVSDENIEAVLLPEHTGKANALNRGVLQARYDILVLTDVSTVFDAGALEKLARHFRDQRVGAVCGTLRLCSSEESARTEGVYWKYDSAMRLMEGRLNATIVATGAIYAIRRACFQPLRPGTILDDLIIPMNARKAGYRVIHDPEALATEYSVDTVSDEFNRRVRIALGSFRALPDLLPIPLDIPTAWAFVSHKLLRWLIPLNLLGMLLSLVALFGEPLYRALLVTQLLFYFWAAVGCIFRRHLRKIRFALIGYFLVSMHLAFVVGFWRYLSGDNRATWTRVRT